MRFRLRHIEFEASLLPAVAAFECGTAPWDEEVSDWIKDPGKAGALHGCTRAHKRTQVWLYVDVDSNVIGFSSLGESNRDEYPRICIIPHVAVATAFQKQGYFSEIMSHLVSEARSQTLNVLGRYPLLGLFVHPQNVTAIDIYTQKYGFAAFPRTYVDEQTGVVYQGMVRRLD